MKHKIINILCTRSLDQLLIEKASDHNLLIHTIAFISTQPIVNDDLKEKVLNLAKEPVNIVFTSTNAAATVADMLGNRHPEWKIYCIAGATKKLIAERYKKSSVYGLANNADELADEIINDKLIYEIVFFSGDQRRDNLPLKLLKNGISVNEIIVYKTVLTPNATTGNYDGILFFSPSAVESFFINNQPDHGTIMFAIGKTTAHTIEQYCTNKVITSDVPAKEQLLELVINHFQTINQKQ